MGKLPLKEVDELINKENEESGKSNNDTKKKGKKKTK